MSRSAERIARLQAKLASLDEVMVVAIEEPPLLLGVIGGGPEARAQAVASWYAKHPGVTPSPEHLVELKAGGVELRSSKSTNRRNYTTAGRQSTASTTRNGRKSSTKASAHTRVAGR